MRERVRIEVGSDTLVMEWDGADAAAPILLDGQVTGFQTADARHDTERAVRLALHRYCEGGPAVEDVWDDVSYETEAEEPA